MREPGDDDGPSSAHLAKIDRHVQPRARGCEEWVWCFVDELPFERL
jgi:hypothetical protein